MTDKELIKQEIERLYKHYLDAQEFDSGYNMALDDILKFLDSLPEESGCEANFTTKEELEKEFNRFLDEKEGVPRMWHSDEQMEWGMDIARHFAEWGRNYFEDKSEMVSEDLEEAACRYCHNLHTDVIYGYHINDAFKAGAEWQKQQMMKDAVEGIVHHFADDELAAVHYNDPKGTPMSIYVSSKGLSAGDIVKIIIVKTEQQ